MKKIPIYLLFLLSALPAFGAVQSATCASIGSGTSSCSACFKETQVLYTCNPYQTSCQKQVFSDLSDTATNISGSAKVMYQFDMGTYSKERLQSTTSWTMSHPTLGEMFEIPQAYLQPASAAGQKGYQYFSSSSRYGHMLPVGTSVVWTQMKDGAWVRPDLASEGSSRTAPAYKMTFTPRLYTNSTEYLDHSQCVFYYVRFCGDGTPDTDRGEQCDDGNMTSGDGCSNTCQTEAPTPLTCDNLSITTQPATLTQSGGTITATCAGTNETQYKFILRQGSSVINTVNYQNSNQTTFSIPANSASSAKDYSVECQVKNATETDKTASACMKSLTVPGTNPVCTTLLLNPPSTTNASTTNGGTVSYECQGVNATSYSVVVKDTNGNTINNFSNATGSFTIPSTPSGTYNVACYINGQTSTPAACQKSVVNTTPENPVCAGLSLTRYDTNDGRQIGFTCTGSSNVTSYSVIVRSPDNTTLTSFNSATGNFTIPTTPSGTYNVACYINGQTSTPSVCQKTVTHNPTVENPVCNNLSVTKNGTSVDYSCTGSGPITSYTIQKDGAFESSNSSGSVYLGYGTHTLKCFINNNITSNACEKSVTIDRPETPTPRIEVIKDDDDNHDDRQTLEVGDDARFSILVRNNGSEGLNDVTLDDPRAPECNRTSSQTRNYISAIGNRDTIFDPGESFTYTCRRDNISMSTFPNNENRVCVAGRGRESGQSVDDCDTTRINFNEEDICDFMRVDFDRIGTPRSHVEVSCSPTDGYRLGIVRNGVLQDRMTSSIGEFEFDLTPGRYSLTCLRDGEDRVQSACTKSITIQEEEKVGECRLRSSVRYGGAPLRTHLSCETPDNNDCRIGVTRNGKVWKTINDCDANLTFTQPGDYEAVCILDGDANQNCSTNVSVDNMTQTQTGPGAPLAMIGLALAGAGVYYYRRRKTA